MEKNKRPDRITKAGRNGELQLPIAHYALINSDNRLTNAIKKISIYGLGSCIALILYDIENCIYAMSHILLPEAKHVHKKQAEKFPHKYADYSVLDLLNEVMKHGALKRNLKAIIVGGSNVFTNNCLEVGKENISAVKKQLEMLKIELKDELVGGNKGRVVICDVSQKYLTVKSTGDKSFNKIILE